VFFCVDSMECATEHVKTTTVMYLHVFLALSLSADCWTALVQDSVLEL
jgi:hypothetical protein